MSDSTPESAAKPAGTTQPAAAPAGASPVPVTPPKPAAAASAAPVATTVATPPAVAGPPKVKIRKHKQRSCDEKNEKGKLCAGHLKRWYTYPKAIESLIGAHSEIYRCEFCHTLYRPDPEQLPNSYTLRY